jgi:hypothetical protein
MLKDLGVKPSKSLPQHLLEQSDDDFTESASAIHSITPVEPSLES